MSLSMRDITCMFMNGIHMYILLRVCFDVPYRPAKNVQDLTYHLLDSLATCKSCVIVALLANEGVPGGLEQLVEMFEVLLTGVRPEHAEVRVAKRYHLDQPSWALTCSWCRGLMGDAWPFGPFEGLEICTGQRDFDHCISSSKPKL